MEADEGQVRVPPPAPETAMSIMAWSGVRVAVEATVEGWTVKKVGPRTLRELGAENSFSRFQRASLGTPLDPDMGW